MPNNTPLKIAQRDEVEELGESEWLTKVFTALGYDKFGTYSSQSGKQTDNATKVLHNILVTYRIMSELNAHVGANLSPIVSSYPFMGSADNMKALIDVITGCKFIVQNLDSTLSDLGEINWIDVVHCGVRDGFRIESTTSSVRTRDLPHFPNSGALLDWFVWKDSARASLKTMGLNKVVEDMAYAITHPRQNAAVDGLIIQAIMKDSSNTNLAVTTDNDIDGDGHARWNKLLQLNENSSLIRIILKDLTGEMDKLYLNSLDRFDDFSGTFMETKGRLEYMVAKGEDSNIDNISDHQVKDWKIKYLDKIHVDELSAIKLQCKKDKTLDLWQTFLEIKAWIIDNVHVERPKKKKKQPEREYPGKDSNDKSNIKEEGGSKNYHKSVVDSIYKCINSNDLDENQKKMMKTIMRTAKSQVTGGKPSKKQKRRKPLPPGVLMPGALMRHMKSEAKKKAGGQAKKKQKVSIKTSDDQYEGSDYDEIPMEYTDYTSE